MIRIFVSLVIAVANAFLAAGLGAAQLLARAEHRVPIVYRLGSDAICPLGKGLDLNSVRSEPLSPKGNAIRNLPRAPGRLGNSRQFVAPTAGNKIAGNSLGRPADSSRPAEESLNACFGSRSIVPPERGRIP